MESIVLAIFVIEAAMKIVACGAQPWDYLLDKWNIFDALIIIGALASVGLDDNSSVGGLIRMMRLLRLFLVFKFMKGQKQLQVITIIGTVLTIPLNSFAGSGLTQVQRYIVVKGHCDDDCLVPQLTECFLDY